MDNSGCLRWFEHVQRRDSRYTGLEYVDVRQEEMRKIAEKIRGYSERGHADRGGCQRWDEMETNVLNPNGSSQKKICC